MPHRLICHPSMPARAVRSVEVDLWRTDSAIGLRFVVDADDGVLALPPASMPERRDELWKTTCFELFVRTRDGYAEFNYSPSTAWAAYGFDDYRSGMRQLDEAAVPEIHSEGGADWYAIEVLQAGAATIWDGAGRASISAVIEEADGTKSYWAIAHPEGQPDFHHADCFVLELPAPETP